MSIEGPRRSLSENKDRYLEFTPSEQLEALRILLTRMGIPQIKKTDELDGQTMEYLNITPLRDRPGEIYENDQFVRIFAFPKKPDSLHLKYILFDESNAVKRSPFLRLKEGLSVLKIILASNSEHIYTYRFNPFTFGSTFRIPQSQPNLAWTMKNENNSFTLTGFRLVPYRLAHVGGEVRLLTRGFSNLTN